MTPRLRGLCRVVELVKVSCWASDAEALLSEELCKLNRYGLLSEFQFLERCECL